MGGGRYGFSANSGKSVSFFVGANGMALPTRHKSWIGVSRREKLLKTAKNTKLRNAINQMYRPGSFIGDGGTASVLKFEKRTGQNIGRSQKGHYTKAVEMERYLRRKVLTDNLNNKDRKIANTLIHKMKRAILEWEGRI
ncbi:MAG: hypothetical protein IKS10_00565 [Lachnospiraceae bacterium]|nr:hypothetical protein [Lachnospiraceae bacterium]